MNTTSISNIANPRRRATAAHKLIDELQAVVLDLSRLRRETFAQLLDAGMNQTQIANLVGISRSRVSQLMSGAAQPASRRPRA